MKTKNCANRLVLAALLACSAIRSRADDLTTSDGKIFQNIEIRELDNESITFSHSQGASRIPLKEFPVEVQLRYSPIGLFLELRRTRAELEKAREELRAVRAESAKWVQPQNVGGGEKDSRTQLPLASKEKPRRPLAELPAVQPHTTVSADEIVQQYRTDPGGAELRYRRKSFRIQGKVERFEERMFFRKTAVILESQERPYRIVCELPFPEEFTAVFGRKGGQLLVGVAKSGREVRLMEIGELLVVEGRCLGLKGAEITFSQCVRIP